NWPLLAAGTVIFGLAGALPAAAQGLRLESVDEAARNPQFAAWRAALLDAVRRRDTEFVVARADPAIKLSFGGDYGRENFRRALTGKEEWHGEFYWRELQAVLELGGVFMEDGAFCTPYLACIDVPGCPECDPFETVYVTRADAVARTKPDPGAPVAAKVFWDVLQLDYEAEGAKGWYPVKLPDGRTVFLSTRDSRMAVDYRARFEKTAKGWRMTVFIAGD
ncbi:MAG: hypothetical protein KAT39_15060, partial [Alphaproteobacteria bacterium]|nr:hypothetical protein [Alphaproteobacteria bacterium]